MTTPLILMVATYGGVVAVFIALIVTRPEGGLMRWRRRRKERKNQWT